MEAEKLNNGDRKSAHVKLDFFYRRIGGQFTKSGY